ncbi:hypothetical protein [Rhodopirellula sp. MGV]|uniref:hypothetical protein n=1 Tax=Rhodopirellula sp. MGV TaxID=2023130 RepID=UPI000B963921|nr:hypothetical protein [Rhodopirellula sp. MGV]OYP37608.1 hypothetical protein CGZ80_04650 [Rhodopirellula sp. MGV]PNY34927.1 hypothetical protein C2E31_20695 [Rhodopirellula baltica]
MKITAGRGDVIAVPINGVWALGRVIFVSKYFKEIMLIEFRGPFSSDAADWHTGRPLVSVYTAAASFERRGWKKVGTAGVGDAELKKSIRVVANEVWEQDVFLRKATANDKQQIPMMLVDGFIRVESTLLRAIAEDAGC